MNRFLLSLPLTLIVCTGYARAEDDVKSRYTKYEFRIPMRDGKRLFTAVYIPKDTSRRYPILMHRTPYSVRPYGADQYRKSLGPSPHFVKAGYIFVYQDVRGRWMSEGKHLNMTPHRSIKKGPKDIDESSDTYDTVAWLVKNIPHHNGKVGQWGISYPGFYTAAGMIDAHPALKAVSPQAPICDWFVGDDFHHNGAFFLPHLFNFISRFDRPRPVPTKKFTHTFDHGTHDGYRYFLNLGPLNEANRKYFKNEVAFWDKVMAHGAYDDFWKARNLRPHLKNIKPAVMVVGGWFDAENLFGPLEIYRNTEANSPGATNFLVMGPWRHGGWNRDPGDSFGDIPFNAKTSTYFQENIQLPFFEYYLKGKGSFKAPEAWVFETGTNQWRQYEAWPPQGSQKRSLFLHPQGGLDFKPPADSKAQAFDEYQSDPNRPVPFIGKITIGMDPTYMVADQRFASTRPDVLVYQTEPLEEDVTLAGPIQAKLHVSTSGTDADWVVKLIDVYPDDYPDPDPNPTELRMGGYQQLVRGDVMRGKFRNSFEKPEPFKSNQPTRVEFKLQDVYHTFRTGHRIMVQVQSTWFPLVDRNPQVFTNIYAAKSSDFRKAIQRVYRSGKLASRLEVRVLPGRRARRNDILHQFDNLADGVAAGKPSEKPPIRKILQVQAKAWNEGNIKAFMEHYWKSDRLTFSSGGKVTRGWENTFKNYQKRYPTREKMGTLSFDGLEVTPLGKEAALVLGRWHLKRKSEKLDGNFTLIFRRIGGRWVIVHDHTSRLPSADGE